MRRIGFLMGVADDTNSREFMRRSGKDYSFCTKRAGCRMSSGASGSMSGCYHQSSFSVSVSHKCDFRDESRGQK